MSDTTLAPAETTSAQTFNQTRVDKMPDSLAQVIAIAKVMAASGFYPDAKTAQQAAAIMILGVQFGIPPAQALTAIHVVKGKPMLHYSAILSKVRQHPDYDYKIIEETDKVAKIEFFRFGESCGVSTFTIEQAKKQGTQNLEKFPDIMLIARAASNGVKRYCPDVLNGMPVYTQGEIEDEAYASPGGSKGDALRAEMQARAEETGALEAEYADVEDTVEVVEEPKPEGALL